MFRDRTDAGEQLAELIAREGVTADVVLAIPRGGLPVGRAVADALDSPLNVIVAKKIAAPGNPELAVGAAASSGSLWRNDELIARLDLDPEQVRRDGKSVAEEAREKAERYRGEEPAPDLDGKTVLLVDDGVATGATMIACVRLAREAGAERIVVAIPVGPPGAIRNLEAEADQVLSLRTPAQFGAVGRFYESFRQVTDEEAIALLEER
jgi:predicted phosphoribosyltransferase